MLKMAAARLPMPMTRRNWVMAPGSFRLFPQEVVLAKERPHNARGVDALARGPEEPLRHPAAAGPGMAAAADGVEYHRRVVGTARVSLSRDIRSDARIGRFRVALIPATPIPRPR